MSQKAVKSLISYKNHGNNGYKPVFLFNYEKKKDLSHSWGCFKKEKVNGTFSLLNTNKLKMKYWKSCCNKYIIAEKF